MPKASRKTSHQLIQEARRDVARLVKRSARLANAALANRTEQDAYDAFSLPAKEAPKWTELVQKITAAASRSETERPASINQSLQVVMVGRDASVADWKARVEAAGKPKMLPVEVVEVEEDKKT